MIEIDIAGAIAVITQLADESYVSDGVADLCQFIATAPNGGILVVEGYIEHIIRVPASGPPISVFLSESTIENVLGHDVDPTGGIDYDLEGKFPSPRVMRNMTPSLSGPHLIHLRHHLHQQWRRFLNRQHRTGCW